MSKYKLQVRALRDSRSKAPPSPNQNSHRRKLVRVDRENCPPGVPVAPPPGDRLRVQLPHRLPLLRRLLRGGDDLDQGLAAVGGAADEEGWGGWGVGMGVDRGVGSEWGLD